MQRREIPSYQYRKGRTTGEHPFHVNVHTKHPRRRSGQSSRCNLPTRIALSVTGRTIGLRNCNLLTAILYSTRDVTNQLLTMVFVFCCCFSLLARAGTPSSSIRRPKCPRNNFSPIIFPVSIISCFVREKLKFSSKVLRFSTLRFFAQSVW